MFGSRREELVVECVVGQLAALVNLGRLSEVMTMNRSQLYCSIEAFLDKRSRYNIQLDNYWDPLNLMGSLDR